LKKIIIHGYEGFDNKRILAEALADFIKARGWKKETICLHTVRKHKFLCRSCQRLALDVPSIHHRSIGRTSADALRGELCDRADGAVIFWNGKSLGTKRLIDMVEERDIPFSVHIE
jgi:hypothetical protein